MLRCWIAIERSPRDVACHVLLGYPDCGIPDCACWWDYQGSRLLECAWKGGLFWVNMFRFETIHVLISPPLYWRKTSFSTTGEVYPYPSHWRQVHQGRSTWLILCLSTPSHIPLSNTNRGSTILIRWNSLFFLNPSPIIAFPFLRLLVLCWVLFDCRRGGTNDRCPGKWPHLASNSNMYD